ncbi:MAG: ATP phosphoribosyltransferase regulatory subunit [Kofleriaceae bacterium]
MSTTPIRLPAGVRDFLPAAAARRRGLAEALLAAFEAWGYARIITPAFECADVLALGLGDDARAAAIRFVEPGSGEVVALRPDITPQVARLVATRYPEASGALRVCYDGAVTRLSADAGPREILQAGIELFDAEPGAGDAELIALAMVALRRAELAQPHLELGHVAPVRHVLGGLPPDDAAALREALLRKDRATAARVAARAPAALAPLAAALCELWGPARDVLARAIALPWPEPVSAALAGLAQALADARVLLGDDAGVPLSIDLGEVRGFDYYTGLRVAGYAAGAGDAVLRGGRYDELVGRYGRAARAVGFAVDVEALAEAMPATESATAAPTTILVLDADRPRAAAVARALRGAGVRVALEAVSSAPTPGLARRLLALGVARALVVRPGGAIVAVGPDGGEVAVAQPGYAAAAAGDAASLLADLTKGASA